VVLLVLLCPGPDAAQAQTRDESPWVPSTLDDRLLLSVYRIDAPLFAATMNGADLLAYPAFYAAVPAAWGGALLLREGRDFEDAFRLTLSFGASYLLSTVGKELIRRPRPTLADVDDRGRWHPRDEREDRVYRFSLPSGHAALAFGLATSYGLSHPHWYVLGPGYVWAASTALSRVWRGRHYPSDVLAGALLGAAVAGAVHLASPHITPSFLTD
jgi:membrane-associated phospholipid phosphatase